MSGQLFIYLTHCFPEVLYSVPFCYILHNATDCSDSWEITDRADYSVTRLYKKVGVHRPHFQEITSHSRVIVVLSMKTFEIVLDRKLIFRRTCAESITISTNLLNTKNNNLFRTHFVIFVRGDGSPAVRAKENISC